MRPGDLVVTTRIASVWDIHASDRGKPPDRLETLEVGRVVLIVKVLSYEVMGLTPSGLFGWIDRENLSEVLQDDRRQ